MSLKQHRAQLGVFLGAAVGAAASRGIVALQSAAMESAAQNLRAPFVNSIAGFAGPVSLLLPGLIAGYISQRDGARLGAAAGLLEYLLLIAILAIQTGHFAPSMTLPLVASLIGKALVGSVCGIAGQTLAASALSNQPLHPTTQAAEPPSSPGERRR